MDRNQRDLNSPKAEATGSNPVGCASLVLGSAGGFGGAVVQTLLVNNALDHGLKVRVMTLPDAFIDQDKPERAYAKAGRDAAGIVAAAFEALNKRGPARLARR